MISKQVFKNNIREVCLLIGNMNPPAEQLKLFYERLRNFEERDFVAACGDDGMIEDLTRMRFNFPTIKRYIEKHQFIRLDAENSKRQKLERAEAERLAKNQEIPEAVRRFIKTFTPDGQKRRERSR